MDVWRRPGGHGTPLTLRQVAKLYVPLSSVKSLGLLSVNPCETNETLLWLGAENFTCISHVAYNTCSPGMFLL